MLSAHTWLLLIWSFVDFISTDLNTLMECFQISKMYIQLPKIFIFDMYVYLSLNFNLFAFCLGKLSGDLWLWKGYIFFQSDVFYVLFILQLYGHLIVNNNDLEFQFALEDLYSEMCIMNWYWWFIRCLLL